MGEDLISLQDLYDTFQNLPAGEVILDVRSTQEWTFFHIPGSLNIPHDQVEEHVEELKKYKKIYIHCRMGGRAHMAYTTLKSKGLSNILCLKDCGIQAWIDEGYPVKKEK